MAPGTLTGQKRKADSHITVRDGPKRRKMEIPVQHRQPGEVNIASFIKAREFEIKALESSMQKARKGLMSRAFQQLPRHMRRRTASHNVKKIPKRLRKRAEREMKEDNTPTVSNRTRTPSRKLRLRLESAKALKKSNQRAKTVRQRKKEAKANARHTDLEDCVATARIPRAKKNKLSVPPTATTKYKKRQVSKTWLPTHLWHAKRAHMTRPIQPLWRMAIPLSPTEKSHRPTHRAAGSRGCIAWDTSYMSTVVCLGTDHTLGNMLTALGFAGEGGSGQKHKRWVAGTRYVQGWARMIDGDKRCVAPMQVIWVGRNTGAENESVKTNSSDQAALPSKKQRRTKLDRKLLIRVHPSAFQIFWLELLKAAKVQKPQVLVEDLRYEIGSIQITGPSSTEGLAGVLKPRHEPEAGSIEEVWTSLAGVGSPASLPACCLLHFDIVDPRLSHPPRQVPISKDPTVAHHLNQLIVSWPPDAIISSAHIVSHKHRWTASVTLPSSKAIQRRKAATGKGEALTVTEKDPSIPILLLAQRSENPGVNTHGSWTVLLPWGFTDTVWRSLLNYPLTSGGTPRFGGLNETRQLAFEQMTAWFPADYPGVEAGKAWERTEAEKRFDEWMRRPPSRRVAWDKVDLGLDRKGEIGNGWACDWDYLFLHSERHLAANSSEAPLALRTETEVARETVGADASEPHPNYQLAPGWVRKAKKQKKGEGTGVDINRRRRNTSSPEPDDDSVDSVANPAPPVDYYQVMASEAVSMLKKPRDALSATPVLAAVRIRLLSKGQPCAAARVYRLPAPTQAALLASQPPQANPMASALTADATPAPGQPSPAPLTSSSSLFTTAPPLPDGRSLREKWLSLVPPNIYHQQLNGPSFPKPNQNHRGLTAKHVAHKYDPPDHIHVLPKTAPQSIIDEFGAKPLNPEQKKQKQKETLMAELMKGDFTPNDSWDADKGLVPCPDAHDLIGFATSGGYNLSQGCGTAIASVWVQRVAKGWKEEDMHAASECATMQGKQKEKYMKRHEKQKHLCVVRNAGESIGRLGLWELCE